VGIATASRIVKFQDERFSRAPAHSESSRPTSSTRAFKITGPATMRAEQGVRLPTRYGRDAMKSGAARLLVGVESGSNEVIKAYSQEHQDRSQVFHNRREDAQRTADANSRSSSASRRE